MIGEDFFGVSPDPKRNEASGGRPRPRESIVSFSDVSECDNHHAGCWHLPRRSKPEEMVDIDEIDVFEQREQTPSNNLWQLNLIAATAIDDNRESLLRSKKS